MYPIDLYHWHDHIVFYLIELKYNPTSPRIMIAFIYSRAFNLNNFGEKIVFECFSRIYRNYIYNQSTSQTRTVFGISKALLQVVLVLCYSKSKAMYDKYPEIAKLYVITLLIYFLELRSVWLNKMSWFEYDYTDNRWICLCKMKGCL